MKKTNPKRNRIVLGWMLLILLFLVPSTASAANISISDPGNVPENGTITYTVTISTTDPSPVDVPFTLSGTALVGTDYTVLTPSPVTIPANAGGVDIQIQVASDNIIETDEALDVVLGAVAGHAVTGD